MSGTLLLGCATAKLQTFEGGACQSFPRPPYQIKGRAQYDQTWADKVTEAGVAGCQWERPAKRPASLDQRKPKAKKRKPVVHENVIVVPNRQPTVEPQEETSPIITTEPEPNNEQQETREPAPPEPTAAPAPTASPEKKRGIVRGVINKFRKKRE